MPPIEHAHRHSTAGHIALISMGLFLLLTGCAPVPASCPGSLPYGLLDANDVNSDSSLPFRFPLAPSMQDENIQSGWFAASDVDPLSTSSSGLRYHTGEDYRRPPGTSVYAIADGIVRYSGPTLQHGWLIAIDHPDANLYSLYAHLDLSGWHAEPGVLMRGDLIGHVGDPDEFSSRRGVTSDPFLHFAIRAGQWGDYPGLGMWRGEGFWVRRCPQELGWLHPSVTITLQTIPAGGYPAPDAGFFVRWWPDLLVTALALLVAVGMVLVSRKWNRPLLIVIPAVLLFLVGSLLYAAGSALGHVLTMATVVVITIGVQTSVDRYRKRKVRQDRDASS